LRLLGRSLLRGGFLRLLLCRVVGLLCLIFRKFLLLACDALAIDDALVVDVT